MSFELASSPCWTWPSLYSRNTPTATARSVVEGRPLINLIPFSHATSRPNMWARSRLYLGNFQKEETPYYFCSTWFGKNSSTKFRECLCEMLQCDAVHFVFCFAKASESCLYFNSVEWPIGDLVREFCSLGQIVDNFWYGTKSFLSCFTMQEAHNATSKHQGECFPISHYHPPWS